MYARIMNSILEQDIMYLPGVGPARKKILSQELGINSFGDLLQYYPYKYVDRSRIYSVREMSADMPFVQLKGRVLSFETFDMGPRKQRLVGHFSDGTGVIDLVWFSGVKWIIKNYKVGTEYIIFGRPSIFGNRYQISHPDIDRPDTLMLGKMSMQPYYHTTERMKKEGLTSRSIEKFMTTLFKTLHAEYGPTMGLKETLPLHIVSRLRLVGLPTALQNIHYPQTADELSWASYRLKFEELFYVQLAVMRYARFRQGTIKGHVFRHVGACFNDFYHNHLPFQLTEAQKRVIREIHQDMQSGHQMNRLVQGDVGSGKTVVALMAMLLAIGNGYQTCIMAPTEILAEQHLATFRHLLGNMDVHVELLTGVVRGKKREAILQDLQDGKIHILVGTHAVIEDNVQFKNLGFVVIDEQHRFGVAQRARLWDKNQIPPHVMVMTATPTATRHGNDSNSNSPDPGYDGLW